MNTELEKDQKNVKDECDCKESETCKCHDDNKDCSKIDNHECHCDNQEHHDKKDKKEKCKKKIKELEDQIKDLEEKNLREKAELINYRKRKDEEVSRMLKYANEDLVMEILPILDNFERAINMDNDNLEDEVSKFLSGFKMIYCNFKNTLEKYEIKAIDGNDKPFDPTYHQAVLTEQVDGVEPGIVIEVMQKGYMLKDKVIRPAMVKVSE